MCHEVDSQPDLLAVGMPAASSRQLMVSDLFCDDCGAELEGTS